MGIARVAEEEDKLLIGKFQGGRGADKREEDMESRECRDIFDLQRSRRGGIPRVFKQIYLFVKVGMSKKSYRQLKQRYSCFTSYPQH